MIHFSYFKICIFYQPSLPFSLKRPGEIFKGKLFVSIRPAVRLKFKTEIVKSNSEKIKTQ